MDQVALTKRLLILGWEDALIYIVISGSGLIWILKNFQLSSPEGTSKPLDWVPQAGLHHKNQNVTLEKSDNIMDSLPDSSSGAVVFWGSQGGTAETFASRMASDLTSHYAVKTVIADLADYDHIHLTKIPKTVPVFFILATYGEGDPTDNAINFMSQLKEIQSRNVKLENLRFLIFGLGNSNYHHYNKISKDADALLREMGAKRIGALGLGNDCKGTTEEDFVHWKRNSMHQMASEFGLSESSSEYKPLIDIMPLKSPALPDSVYRGEPHGLLLPTPDPTAPKVPKAPVVLPLTEAYELTHSGTRQFIHLEFNLDLLPTVRYNTGDYLKIWPINPEEEVSSWIKLLGLSEKRDEVMSVTPSTGANQSKSKVPSPTTLESMFRYYLDICGPTSRDFLSGLAQFLPKESFGKHIQPLCGDAGSYRDKVSLRRLRPTEILARLEPEECSQIPLSFIVENMKKMQPRSYSISSSGALQPRSIAVTALVVNEEMAAEEGLSPAEVRNFEGLTTNYLLNLKQQWGQSKEQAGMSSVKYMIDGPRGILQKSNIYAQVRTSKFRLPTTNATPIIMIGTGSGVAPFRAFVQERAMHKQKSEVVGRTVLFVGHRSPDEDFIYRDEWKQAQDVLGENFELHTAFSRSAGQPKQYVQDVLLNQIDVVLEVLSEKTQGVIYICGSSAMAAGVKDCIQREWTRFASAGGQSVDAEAWLREHKRAGRLVEDTWG